MSEERMKQRMMSWSDLQSPQYRRVPDEAKPTAQALWLLMDVMGRGPLDEPWLAGEIFPELAAHVAMDRLSEHLLMLMDAEFLTTFVAEGREWILLLRPLKADTRRARIETPEPPEGSPWTSVAVGRGRVGERARERARAQVRAEGAARADAWAALQGDAVREPLPPRRPLTLDAPPRFCSEHMPYGTRENCGPCRDARNVSSDWIDRKVYEERLAHHYAQQDDEEPF